jgi:hypothetical protein
VTPDRPFLDPNDPDYADLGKWLELTEISDARG